MLLKINICKYIVLNLMSFSIQNKFDFMVDSSIMYNVLALVTVA